MKSKFKEVKKKILAEEGKETEQTKEKEEVEVEVNKTELPGEFKSTIASVLDLTFNVIAKRKGEKWKLQPQELEALSNSYVVLAGKYLPSALNRWAIESTAMFWTVVILLKRIF